jgi:broad specificity phosphatase PhoE
MGEIFLVRHGEAGGEQIDVEGWWGPMRDQAALTDKGVEQAKAVGRELRGYGATHVISSTMTRALHTAALIAAETGLPLTAVEFDLREWLPDSTLSWRTFDEVMAQSNDLAAHGGEWPPGETRTWEPMSAVRARATRALRRQPAGAPFIAVCHGMVIEALTGLRHTEHCGIRSFHLPES